MLKASLAIDFKSKTFLIRNNDAYWITPSDLFENNQGQASDKHFVKMRIVKWLANPFLFEQKPNGFAGQNFTEFSFYDASGAQIEIN